MVKNQKTGGNGYKDILAKSILSAREHSQIPLGSASVGQRTKGPGESGGGSRLPLLPLGWT